LINHGTDIHLKDKNGQTALHFSAISGNISLFLRLIDKGLNIEERDKLGRQAIHLAALEGIDNLAFVIISITKNLSEGDNEGQTPLHLATFGLNYRIIRHLLIAGADKRVVDKHGKSPEDIAKARENPQISLLLVRKR
jgi:ankyrin repeat protein